jgi:hypothetical protein
MFGIYRVVHNKKTGTRREDNLYFSLDILYQSKTDETYRENNEYKILYYKSASSRSYIEVGTP